MQDDLHLLAPASRLLEAVYAEGKLLEAVPYITVREITSMA